MRLTWSCALGVNLECSVHGKASCFSSAGQAKKELRREDPQETTHHQGSTPVLAYGLERKHTPWVSCPLSRNGTDPIQSSLRMQENISQALLIPWATITTLFLSNSFSGSGSPAWHRLWINTVGLLDFWIEKYNVAHKERVGLHKSVCSRNSKNISHRNNGDKAERRGDLLPPPSTLHLGRI